MNEQQLFEKAYRGLAKQGFERSMRPNSVKCAYRGVGGLKCAIGHAIPDELYRLEMDAPVTPIGLDFEGILIRAGYTGSTNFASELQSIHDTAKSPAGMRATLAAFAESHGLPLPKLESES